MRGRGRGRGRGRSEGRRRPGPPREAAPQPLDPAGPGEAVTPLCRHFGACGGCSWQHLAYPAQLLRKRAAVEAAARAGLGRAVPVEPTLGLAPGPAPKPLPPGADPLAPWGFRDKVHFTLGPSPEGPVLSHHLRSGGLFAVEECPVHAERGNELARRAVELLRRLRIPGTDPRSVRGVARHLVVRVAERTGQTLVTLVATRERVERLKELVAGLMQGEDPPSGLHLDVHDAPGPYLFGHRGRKLHGRARLMEELGGAARYLVSPTAFFQTSGRGAELLVREVLAQVPPEGPVLDLFAGAGLFALPLALRGQPVLAIEENAAAVEDGVASRELNGIPPARCRFVAGRAELELERLRAAGTAFACAIVDPPRDGCPPGTLERLLRGVSRGGDETRTRSRVMSSCEVGLAKPRTRLVPAAPICRARLVYVSCHLEALTRDLREAARLGWTPVRVQPIDMFPHTPHVETVVTLEPRA